MTTSFNESDHPRDGVGKFAAKDNPESEASLDAMGAYPTEADPWNDDPALADAEGSVDDSTFEVSYQRFDDATLADASERLDEACAELVKARRDVAAGEVLRRLGERGVKADELRRVPDPSPFARKRAKIVVPYKNGEPMDTWDVAKALNPGWSKRDLASWRLTGEKEADAKASSLLADRVTPDKMREAMSTPWDLGEPIVADKSQTFTQVFGETVDSMRKDADAEDSWTGERMESAYGHPGDSYYNPASYESLPGSWNSLGHLLDSLEGGGAMRHSDYTGPKHRGKVEPGAYGLGALRSSSNGVVAHRLGDDNAGYGGFTESIRKPAGGPKAWAAASRKARHHVHQAESAGANAAVGKFFTEGGRYDDMVIFLDDGEGNFSMHLANTGDVRRADRFNRESYVDEMPPAQETGVAFTRAAVESIPGARVNEDSDQIRISRSAWELASGRTEVEGQLGMTI